MKFTKVYLAIWGLFLLPMVPMTALTVTLDDDYPPYSFRNPQGALQGISIDLWKLWSQKTGEPVHFIGLPWSAAVAFMDDGKADVLDTVFLTPERAQKWAFTSSYAPIPTGVFHRNGLVGIHQTSDLQGYVVGVKTGDAGANALRASKLLSLVEYPSYDALVDAAGRGEVLAFCMDTPAAVHFLLAKGLSHQFRQAFVLAEDNLRRAVALNRPDTLALVNRGFSQIGTQEALNIDRRWKGSPAALGPWVVVLGAGLALIAVLVVAVCFLRRQNLRRAGELEGAEARLRLSEDRARALVAALPDLLYIINAQGIVVESLSPPGNRRYQNPERFVGQSLVQAFGPRVATEALKKVEALPMGEVVTLEADLELRGELRSFESQIVRLADGRFLAIVRDVSESRRAWKDDLRRNKLESLGLLAGGLAHDFNNSLGVIQGFVSLARIQLDKPEKARASLDKAVQATRRAAGLTSQLRVLAQGGEVHRTVLSVRTLAEEAAEFALVGSPCLLSVDADEGPWTVEADPDQLSQVFHNLILNAVQSMPQGGTVTLVFRHQAGQVLVSVVDEGPGIPLEHRERIFDPYFTTKPTGSGLGLSVVQAVIQRHGGSVALGEPGPGTVFTVRLPASEGTEVPSAAQPSSQEEFRGRRALIMEDETDLRELLTVVCESLGFETVTTRNGTDALAAFRQSRTEGRPFDLLVSDLLVPGDMGGHELLIRLRESGHPFKALAVTGYSAPAPLEVQGQGTFDVVIGKPFTIDELKARIAVLMKSPWKPIPT